MVGRRPTFMTILCVSKSAAGRLSLFGVRFRLAHLSQGSKRGFSVMMEPTKMERTCVLGLTII